MSTTTATKIETRTWTGRTGIVRHYITNLGQIVGKDYDLPRSISAWINPDGTWEYKGFNNSSWLNMIDAAVKAHLAGTPETDVPAVRPARTSTMPTTASGADFADWLTRAMDSEDGI